MEDYYIDFERLRSDLIDNFLLAATFFNNAFGDVLEVESCEESRLIQIALENSIDLNNYIRSNKFKK